MCPQLGATKTRGKVLVQEHVPKVKVRALMIRHACMHAHTMHALAVHWAVTKPARDGEMPKHTHASTYCACMHAGAHAPLHTGRWLTLLSLLPGTAAHWQDGTRNASTLQAPYCACLRMQPVRRTFSPRSAGRTTPSPMLTLSSSSARSTTPWRRSKRRPSGCSACSAALPPAAMTAVGGSDL